MPQAVTSFLMIGVDYTVLQLWNTPEEVDAVAGALHLPTNLINVMKK